MLTLDTLNIMLVISKEVMIEEMIVALSVSPKMVVFFKKFLRLKKAITDDIPRWRESLCSRLKDTHVSPELMERVICYQQDQLLSHVQSIAQLPQILSLLHRLHSPRAGQAQ